MTAVIRVDGASATILDDLNIESRDLDLITRLLELRRSFNYSPGSDVGHAAGVFAEWAAGQLGGEFEIREPDERFRF